jgi:large subunit ribosomal protein L10
VARQQDVTHARATVHPAKADVVAELAEAFRNSSAAVLTEYRGLTVKQLSELRRAMGSSTTYSVTKNTLTKLAAEAAGLTGLDALLSGPTAVAFVKGDPVEAAKGLRDFGKANPALVVKGGVLDGKALSTEEIRKLADLESREVMLAKLAGAAKAALTAAAAAAAAPAVKLAALLDALADNLEATAPPAAHAAGAAPADDQDPAEPDPAPGTPDPAADPVPTAPSGPDDPADPDPDGTPDVEWEIEPIKRVVLRHAGLAAAALDLLAGPELDEIRAAAAAFRALPPTAADELDTHERAAMALLVAELANLATTAPDELAPEGPARAHRLVTALGQLDAQQVRELAAGVRSALGVAAGLATPIGAPAPNAPGPVAGAAPTPPAAPAAPAAPTAPALPAAPLLSTTDDARHRSST